MGLFSAGFVVALVLVFLVLFFVFIIKAIIGGYKILDEYEKSLDDKEFRKYKEARKRFMWYVPKWK